ncbi:MAG: hypothetical protein A2Y31_05640 [Spirochaetes bacterium GWC2_52_13]|nr:MAG: hypothetical protein A2Y31_05640 [Spirochaetes bacterium GWC2_52_13]HCG62603.1 hypothetical protein [Sphaerochaeta sp.]
MTRKNFITGIAGSILLIFIYFLTVYLSNSRDPGAMLWNFSQVWYWILILAGGFGIQLGLYSYVRQYQKGGGKTVAANSALSTGAMIACCAHNLVGLLPILGLSAAALFVVRFQTPIILIGVFSNLVGITIILSMIRNHSLYTRGTKMEQLAGLPWRNIRRTVLTLGLVAIAAASFASFQSENGGINTNQPQPVLQAPEPRKDSRNDVDVVVEPEIIEAGEAIVFRIGFSTHVVELDFDAAEVAGLFDNQGNEYALVSWQGDPPGGHHREIILEFEPAKEGVVFLELLLKNINQADRKFKWLMEP